MVRVLGLGGEESLAGMWAKAASDNPEIFRTVFLSTDFEDLETEEVIVALEGSLRPTLLLVRGSQETLEMRPEEGVWSLLRPEQGG